MIPLLYAHSLVVNSTAFCRTAIASYTSSLLLLALEYEQKKRPSLMTRCAKNSPRMRDANPWLTIVPTLTAEFPMHVPHPITTSPACPPATRTRGAPARLLVLPPRTILSRGISVSTYSSIYQYSALRTLLLPPSLPTHAPTTSTLTTVNLLPPQKASRGPTADEGRGTGVPSHRRQQVKPADTTSASISRCTFGGDIPRRRDAPRLWNCESEGWVFSCPLQGSAAYLLARARGGAGAGQTLCARTRVGFSSEREVKRDLRYTKNHNPLPSQGRSRAVPFRCSDT
ncbi:hypothetical protein EW146_g7718 [Bondarzewia mesenterica]|uniref:Uncharacterized protein n=1 Tax=Bondarzewia mesenterica TaxID=1095465 RepID=A0A4S4LK22_9AGAM|nr:hypothetical protein EW146_g7718 [Bondarzewia mesenterica]